MPYLLRIVDPPSVYMKRCALVVPPEEVEWVEQAAAGRFNSDNPLVQSLGAVSAPPGVTSPCPALGRRRPQQRPAAGASCVSLVFALA